MQVDQNICIGCGACQAMCPAGAIRFKNGKSEIDQSKCLNCGSCATVCPMGCISK